jgi:DNA-binding transcriptional LysR family regulator
MPDFADFTRLHPEIELEILSGDDPVNLTNRQAEVAIRHVFNRSTLPPNLYGLKGPELSSGVYMSRERLAAWRAGAPDPIRWIVRNRDGVSDWARKVDVPASEVLFIVTDAVAQVLAVRLGLGMAALACFVADADPLLVRVPGSTVRPFGTLWLLTQGEARKTKRVRLFTEFMARRLANHAPLLAGAAHKEAGAEGVFAG